METQERNVKEMAMMSIFEVFEKMYYIFLEPRDSACVEEGRWAVEIRFSGALRGEMHAYYAEPLAETMIGNALNIDKEEITVQIREDCLKECINMICGSFLQRYEPDKSLQLSIPLFMGKASVPRVGEIPDAIQLAFEADGVPLDAIIKIAKEKDVE